MNKLYRDILLLLLGFLLPGCGLTIPHIHEAWDHDVQPTPEDLTISATGVIEYEIKRKIYCELRRAVIAVQKVPYWKTDPKTGKEKLQPGLLPLKWGAAIAISLQVDESAALNPGIAFNDVFANSILRFGPANTVTTAQSFSLGIGGTLSSIATRIDKFNPYYTVADLQQPISPKSQCANEQNDVFHNFQPSQSSPFLLESDLGIQDWLYGALIANSYIESDPGTSAAGSGPKTDAISYEIKFIIVSSANVNPTWKLAKFSANTATTPLFGVSRARTHDLIITIGPNTQSTRDVHLANLINR